MKPQFKFRISNFSPLGSSLTFMSLILLSATYLNCSSLEATQNKSHSQPEDHYKIWKVHGNEKKCHDQERIELSWDAHRDAIGYKIHFSEDNDITIDVGNKTHHLLYPLKPNTDYYIYLSAYNKLGKESDRGVGVDFKTCDVLSPVPKNQ